LREPTQGTESVAEQKPSREELLARIRTTLADLLDNKDLQLSESTVADDVDDWDSINHVRLLIELERELGFRFGADEASGLKNVGELIDVIQAKLS
jgi:acyl carrier protein